LGGEEGFEEKVEKSRTEGSACRGENADGTSSSAGGGAKQQRGSDGRSERRKLGRKSQRETPDKTWVIKKKS